MKFFKPEDFELSYLLSLEDIVDLANAKLEREGAYVYSPPLTYQEHGVWYGHESIYYTRKAFLINIEPIKKCLHPKEKVTYMSAYIPRFHRCECGAKVQAVSFEEVK